MRFSRYERFEFNDTPRKRAHVLRRQRNEREALPLFADQIAAEQPDVDVVMEARRNNWRRHEQTDRDRRAEKWRQGRARLAAYPIEIRGRLLNYWNNHRWLPGTPAYFLDMMHMWDSGVLHMNAPGAVSPESRGRSPSQVTCGVDSQLEVTAH